MGDKEKAVISGVTVVITMIKLIIQHRGQKGVHKCIKL